MGGVYLAMIHNIKLDILVWKKLHFEIFMCSSTVILKKEKKNIELIRSVCACSSL